MNPHGLTTLAAMSDLDEGLALTVVGMVVVFIALSIVGLAITLAGRLFAEKPKAVAPPAPPPAPAPVEAPAVAPSDASARLDEPAMADAHHAIPPHHVVAIAAAVAAVVRGRHAVRRLRRIDPASASWVALGRAAHHAGRNVPR